MHDEQQGPQVFRLLQGEALDIHDSPTGRVGRVFCGEGLEAVWVAKQQEVIDEAWFSQPTVDLLTILQGQLRVEFEQELQTSMVLGPGDLLVLPPHTRCRAYRWPRDRQEATIFLAVYPVRDEATPTTMSKTGEEPSQV
jgi:quercetin dioxygenase-like cupin family protein